MGCNASASKNVTASNDQKQHDNEHKHDSFSQQDTSTIGNIGNMPINVITGLSMPLVLANEQGIITKTNNLTVQFFGYPNMVGMHVEQLMPKAIAEKHQSFVTRYLESEGTKHHTSRIIGHKGRVVQVVTCEGTSKLAYLTISRKKNGFLAAFFDINFMDKIKSILLN